MEKPIVDGSLVLLNARFRFVATIRCYSQPVPQWWTILWWTIFMLFGTRLSCPPLVALDAALCEHRFAFQLDLFGQLEGIGLLEFR